MSYDCLRQGAQKGRQVLYVWDCAGIDFGQWYKWKQSAGIYFLSRLNEKIKATVYGDLPFDADDDVNKGVLSDQLIHTATGGVPLRLITYQCPKNGTIYEFITNEMSIRPGVLAWLYMRRWDIEKTYDTFKNKMNECKAWASSDIAKSMQALFICLTHNLMIILESDIKHHKQIKDQKEIERSRKRTQIANISAENAGRILSKLYQNPEKRSQLCLKFIRWLRYHIQANSSYSTAIRSLKAVYLKL